MREDRGSLTVKEEDADMDLHVGAQREGRQREGDRIERETDRQ